MRKGILSLSLLALAAVQAVPAEDVQLVPKATIPAVDGLADVTQGSIKWSHGAFLYHDSRNGGAPPTFLTLDRNGSAVSSATAVLPGRSGVVVGSVDRSTDGAIAFSGQSNSEYGETDTFLAFMTPGGKTTHVVDTAPYFAYSVSFAPDGTVWTLGCEMINHNPKAAGLDPGAGVLRHFDISGKLLGAGIPQSQFDEHQFYRLSQGQIAVTSRVIGWYSYREGTHYYAEISPDTVKITHEYPGAPFLSQHGFVTRFAMTDSGIPVLTFQDNTAKTQATRVPTFYFNRDSQRWITLPVNPLGAHNFVPGLVGNDGDQLVFESYPTVAFFSLRQ